MDSFIDEKDKFNAINEAVCYWLGYQFKIGRERLIHEASLRYPIADTLTANGTEIKKVFLEKGHPYFIDRYIDIFVLNKNVDEIIGPLPIDWVDSIFELKLAKQDTGIKLGKENQRVVNDILRLAYFNLISKKNAYFLICGPYQEFKNYFIGQIEEQKKDEHENIIIGEKDSWKNKDQNKWDIENSLTRTISILRNSRNLKYFLSY